MNYVLASPAGVALKCTASGFAKTRVVCIIMQFHGVKVFQTKRERAERRGGGRGKGKGKLSFTNKSGGSKSTGGGGQKQSKADPVKLL